ncbi:MULTISPECIES: hypothetical protein [unclassified Microbacterium]|uniref:hypothetical protein n=1 Tax=unclassified Microbacterium TaxID=2609290 RepID=UPI00386E32E9
MTGIITAQPWPLTRRHQPLGPGGRRTRHPDAAGRLGHRGLSRHPYRTPTDEVATRHIRVTAGALTANVRLVAEALAEAAEAPPVR